MVSQERYAGEIRLYDTDLRGVEKHGDGDDDKTSQKHDMERLIPHHKQDTYSVQTDLETSPQHTEYT